MPAPERSAARAASRAAPVRCAAPLRTRTAPRAYLWLSAPGVRERPAPDGGRVDEGLRRDARERRFGNADVGEPDRPAEHAPRQQQVARFEAEEGDARARLDRDAANLAGLAVETGGNVDRDHAPAGAGESIDALDDRFRDALDVAREPGAEQSVDDAIGAAGIDGCGVEDLALVARGGERRIAPQRFAPAEEPELDRVAALCQEPRGDEAVAAVAAGAAEDDDPAARLREPRRLVGDRERPPAPSARCLAFRRRSAKRSASPISAGVSSSGMRLGIEHGGEGARPLVARRKRQKRAFHRPGFCYIPGRR